MLYFFVFYRYHRCPVCREWIGSLREIRKLYLMTAIGDEIRVLRTTTTVEANNRAKVRVGAPKSRYIPPSNSVPQNVQVQPQRITRRRATIAHNMDRNMDHNVNRPRRVINQASSFNYVRCTICARIMPSFNNDNMCFMCNRQFN